jgi:hypothetical protein
MQAPLALHCDLQFHPAMATPWVQPFCCVYIPAMPRMTGYTLASALPTLPCICLN